MKTNYEKLFIGIMILWLIGILYGVTMEQITLSQAVSSPVHQKFP